MDGFPPRPTPLQAAERRRRVRGRNVAMLVVLLALAILFFALTIAKFH